MAFCGTDVREKCIMLMGLWSVVQLMEAAAGRFNPHVHVEYEWNLRLEEIDESDDDLDDKVCASTFCFVLYLPLLELYFALSVKSKI